MFKKVSLVVAVAALLAMGSLASAGPTLDISATSIAVSGTSTITINAVDDAGIQDYLSYLDFTPDVGYSLTNIIGGDALGDLGMIVGPYALAPNSLEIEVTRAASTGTAPFGTLLSLTFTGLAEGTYDLVLYDWRDESIAGQGSITVTPEPATMALLGLGGLLLRKRK
jgi:hypothetical protein